MSESRSVESIFSAALQKESAEARAAFLQDACAGNEPLRRQVERLLQAVPQLGNFMGQPIAATEDEPVGEAGPEAQAAPTLPPRPIQERAGTRIGPYKLLQQIGEGGMGVVYMAEQEQPIRRRVALKIIKPGMDSAPVIARFEAERQALAMMDYLNIARVFDAGTTDSGRPYFVMELVNGVPITHYCDENKLSLAERLALFVPVCRALQHAHQKGIIHRDVKPSNVLVTLYDGKPVPKVIDFGVAKAIEQKLTERTMFTQYGAIVGTLEYMAPEQAEMSGLGVDTRSDIYSLGVLLYELLTGTTPVEQRKVRELAYVQLLRMIQEDEPPKPSTRLSTTQELARIAAQRGTLPRDLTNRVRGELDWIVMKALEKDRTRRYETAASLARDVERFLSDEPVEAGPPSARYRLRKFARRYRRGLRIAGVFLLFVIAGAVFSAWEAFQARRAAQMALEQRDRAVSAEATAIQARVSETDQRRQAESARDDEKKARNVAEAERTSAARARDDAERALYFNRISLAHQVLVGQSPRSIGPDSQALPRRPPRLGVEISQPSAPRRPADAAGKRPVHHQHPVQPGRPTHGGFLALPGFGRVRVGCRGEKTALRNRHENRQELHLRGPVGRRRDDRPGRANRRCDVVAGRHRQAAAAIHQVAQARIFSLVQSRRTLARRRWGRPAKRRNAAALSRAAATRATRRLGRCQRQGSLPSLAGIRLSRRVQPGRLALVDSPTQHPAPPASLHAGNVREPVRHGDLDRRCPGQTRIWKLLRLQWQWKENGDRRIPPARRRQFPADRQSGRWKGADFASSFYSRRRRPQCGRHDPGDRRTARVFANRALERRQAGADWRPAGPFQVGRMPRLRSRRPPGKFLSGQNH